MPQHYHSCRGWSAFSIITASYMRTFVLTVSQFALAPIDSHAASVDFPNHHSLLTIGLLGRSI
ncbi:hypothetical protein M431DRAFT_511031 [Trichoderma harzianum CBS 226.95]|uniref:Uncharacterized protein n=1 Tax=Trichoderma harzianum CBS 226.95 TaxID=983964 RepID=A0A2T4A4A1_TRIHA|nr:hypothetical protein M431DRAFT_511031 [Trichoderma harzianum CBS 226.95]PTB51876.1 hypothetical protein M431DRAFT_511031 [Trichoderma harzianum CBS 226.95]